MADVIVVGGGPGGLMTALCCARRGHAVTVVERSDDPPDGPADVLAAWDRPGVAQSLHSHYFLARSTRVLREEAPDLLDALDTAGIGPSSTVFGPGFDEDRALLARRPVYEATMRRFVGREPGVTIVRASVRGLLIQDTHVRGVRLDDGTAVTADLVVDAAGRRSASSRWLTDAGLDPPSVQDDPCHAHYYCRHYRLRDGAEYPSDQVPLGQLLPYAMVLVFLGDSRTFSVAVELSANDPLRTRLQDPEVFDHFATAVPLTAPWLDVADPVSDVLVMAGLSNRQRRLVANGQPVATGLVLAGDASHYTNPALGQGVSLTFWMAQHLANLVERVTGDPAEVTRQQEAWTRAELEPRYQRQVRVDEFMTAQFEAGLRGEGYLPPPNDQSRWMQAVSAVAGQDADLQMTVNRVGHLLEPTDLLFQDPDIAARARAWLDANPDPSAPGIPLPRDRFEELVGA